jgi:hypothetical protein
MARSFLQAPNGDFSSARLMFVIGLSYDMVMTTVGLLLLKWTPGEAIAFFTAVAGIFVGLKLGQKPMENKLQENESNRLDK